MSNFENPNVPPPGGRQPHPSIVFLSPKLVCDALDRPSPDAERLGNLQDTHALRKLLSNLTFRRTVYLRPAELHPLSNRALEAGFDALANHCALKLSERAGDLENELAHRRRRVDGLLVEVEIDPTSLQMPDGAEQVEQRPTKPIYCPGHDDIELPPGGVLEHGIESRPSVSSLGT